MGGDDDADHGGRIARRAELQRHQNAEPAVCGLQQKGAADDGGERQKGAAHAVAIHELTPPPAGVEIIAEGRIRRSLSSTGARSLAMQGAAGISGSNRNRAAPQAGRARLVRRRP